MPVSLLTSLPKIEDTRLRLDWQTERKFFTESRLHRLGSRTAHFGCGWQYEIGHGASAVCVLWLVNTGEFYAHTKITGPGGDLYAYMGRTVPGKRQDALDVMSGWENANNRHADLEWVWRKLHREYRSYAGFAKAYMRRHGYHSNRRAIYGPDNRLVSPSLWHLANLLIDHRVGGWVQYNGRILAHSAMMEVDVLHAHVEGV